MKKTTSKASNVISGGLGKKTVNKDEGVKRLLSLRGYNDEESECLLFIYHEIVKRRIREKKRNPIDIGLDSGFCESDLRKVIHMCYVLAFALKGVDINTFEGISSEDRAELMSFVKDYEKIPKIERVADKEVSAICNVKRMVELLERKIAGGCEKENIVVTKDDITKWSESIEILRQYIIEKRK